MFRSSLSVARDFHTPWFQVWKDRLRFGDRMHRKAWELAVVAETLDSEGQLSHGQRGLGFGVGNEPLPRYFADRGCQIVATDLGELGWADAHSFQERNCYPGIETRIVDMNNLEHGGRVETGAYDFTWSVCSLDHCGSVWLSQRFLLNQMNCLKAGGLAIHTAEYSFAAGMPRTGGTVFFSPADVRETIDWLRLLGHETPDMDWFLGDRPEDHVVDPPPYQGAIHLKVEFPTNRWTTCMAIAARATERSRRVWLAADEVQGRQQLKELSTPPPMEHSGAASPVQL